MCMEVEIKLESWSIVALQLHGEFIQSSDLREDMFVEFIELPIEVFSAETGSEIAGNYSVGVEHRHHVEDKALSEYVASWIIWSKISY